MEKSDYRAVQISQLQRDIKMIEDIIEGRMENYTQHPISTLQRSLSDYKNKLNTLQQENIAENKGGL